MSDIAKCEKEIMDLLIMLLDDQTGKKHEYRLIDDGEDKTA